MYETGSKDVKHSGWNFTHDRDRSDMANTPERESEASQLAKKAAQHERKFSRSRERLDVPDTPELERIRRWVLKFSLECVHGPEEIPYEQDELVVLCLLRNARSYVH